MQVCRKMMAKILPASIKINANNIQLMSASAQYCSKGFNLDYYTKTPSSVARTSLKHPREHTTDHIGMFYKLEPEMVKRLFQFGGVPKRWMMLHEVFNETCFMIRKPALTIIDYISRCNLEYPPNKFLLYGRNGTGKTASLAHIIHHLAEEKWLLVHTSIPAKWSATPKEIFPSSTRPGFYDHTIDAALWLQNFRQQNAPLLENPELVTTESYQWTQRQSTEIGSPILSIVDFGIARPRYASDCVFCLITELKKHAQDGRIKMAVVFDGINSLFATTSKFLTEDKTAVSPEYFTLVQAFLQLLQDDWRNGVIVGSVDIIMSTKERRESHLPRYLLGKKGWEALDPFVPVVVEPYTDEEFESAVNYYVDRMWLQHPAGATKEGRQEMSFMSANNPMELMKIVNAH